MSRLAEEIRDEWSSHSEGREADLDYVTQFLEKEIRPKTRCQSISGLHNNQKSDTAKRSKTSKAQDSASALLSSRYDDSECCGCRKRNQKPEKC